MTTVSLIVAMAENRCIGKDNKMPWHIPEDLKRFKSLTMGAPVIMGRKTFESIIGYLGKPLPGRENIIISKSGYQNDFNAPVFSSIPCAITHAKTRTDNEIFIIGGAQIYTQSIENTDRIHLTKIHQNVEGDAFFPEIKTRKWKETDRSDYLKNNPPYSFITLERQ